MRRATPVDTTVQRKPSTNPFEHYNAWKAEIGPNPLLSEPGAFGENLSTTGLLESDVAVGDVFKLGSAVI